MRKPFWRTLSILILCLIIPFQAVNASVKTRPEKAPLSAWREIRTQSFAIIYPGIFEQIAQGLNMLYGPMLDSEYQRFSQLFQQELAPPISVRIYTDADEYYKLNALAPELGDEQTHSHIGAREISLIGDRVAANINMWQAEAENAFRFELAQLFVTEMSDNQIPAGLKASIGGYAQDPQTSIGVFAGAGLGSLQATSNPQQLWEDENLYIDPVSGIQGLSSVAFLVEAYGWQNLMDFIRLIPKSESYQEAFNTVYDIEWSEFDSLWKSYFPAFINERWQYNVLYNHDPAKYEILIQAGAYSDTAKELEEVLAIMDIMGTSANRGELQSLLDNARKGSSASSLAFESRQAFLNGDMQTCIDKANQAEQFFNEINDPGSIEILNEYRQRAAQAAEIRKDVEKIRSTILFGNPRVISERLNEAAFQLGELGDVSGQEMVYEAIQELAKVQKPKQLILIALIVLLSAAVIWYRIRLMKKAVPPEAKL